MLEPVLHNNPNPKVHPFKRRFRYFHGVLGQPDWTDKKVLDFGGNAGNVLRDPECQIEPRDYYCLDVVPDAVAQGARDYPQAHWVHYDRWNFAYNPIGTAAPLPTFDVRFDYILAFSVFTHTMLTETMQTIDELMSLLNEGGRLAFSLFDYSCIDHFFKKRPGDEPLHFDDAPKVWRAVERSDWFTSVNRTDLYVDRDPSWDEISSYPIDERQFYLVFHRPQYIRDLWPSAEIKPPHGGEIAYCVVMSS